MIEVEGLSFSYPNAERPALAGATFSVAEGELLLVIGPSGGGKSTLLRCLNGLIPHFHGGSLSGRVSVAGLDPHTEQPRDMARAVAMVFQHPESQMVAETVEDDRRPHPAERYGELRWGPARSETRCMHPGTSCGSREVPRLAQVDGDWVRKGNPLRGYRR